MAGFDANLTVTPAPTHTIRGSLQHFSLNDVPRYDRYVTFRSPTVGSDAEHLFDPQTRQLAFARHTYVPMRAGLMRLETTLSLATQREGRSRIPLDDSGQPSDERTKWRDDVFTPGASIVGSSFLAVGGRALVLSWGGDWQHDVLNSEGYVETVSTGATTPLFIDTDSGPMATGNFPDGAQADRLGIFVSGDLALSELVRLSAGGRWSRFHNQATLDTDFGGAVSNSSADLTAQLGVVITPAESWRIAARVAEGFRAPNLYDLTRVGPVPGGVALPNPGAEPERSLTGELAVRYAAPRAALEVSAYYTRVSDFIDRVPGEFQGDTLFNGERVFQGRNVGTARLRGIEAEGATAVGPLRFRASLLFAHGEQEAAAGGEEPMSKIPPLTGLMSVRWNIPVRALSLEYLVRWAARQNRLSSRDLRDPRIPVGGTPGFAVHGIRASATVSTTLSVSAGVENLTDALYRPHASGVDGAGRHVWLGLSVVGGL
jgi:outer membrane receptor protein involved in Fe transport